MNATMPALKRAFEAAGFTDVITVLSSGNAVFNARRSSESALQRKAEAAIRDTLGRTFLTIVRPVDMLQEMLASDPWRGCRLGPGAKRIVTFLREEPATRVVLPVEVDGARLLRLRGKELFSAYLPSPKGAVFMTLIERTFGKELTTRTADTVSRVARA